MLQDNLKQLSKLLLTGYQISSVRIPIEYGGRVTRCSISCFVTAGLWPRSGYRVALVNQKVMHQSIGKTALKRS